MKWELLLIDDEECILDSLAELLAEDDIVVTKAKNGREGLNLLQEKHFDVVISDITMPHMDGITMLNSAKEKGIFVPTIFFSALTNPLIMAEIKKSGAAAVIPKPHFERLSSELNSILTRNQFMFNAQMILETAPTV